MFYRIRSHFYYNKEIYNLAFTFVLTIFTIMYAIISYIQWDTMNKHFTIEERPWITASYTNSKLDIQRKILNLDISLINVGRTPALNTKIKFNPYFAHKYKLIDSSLYKYADRNFTISPGQTRHVTSSTNFMSYDLSIIGKPLYINLIIEYDDIFKMHHKTSDCIYLIENGTFMLCDAGSTMD